MGLMSDLKEFTTNFMLAAGQGIAENIKQSAKEDKAAILAATKDLKSRIAKNKAAQTKIDNKITDQLNTTLLAAPGLADHPDLLRTYLQTDGAYNMLLDTIKDDKDKSGLWLSAYANEKGFDPKDIYKKSKRKISRSDIQSPLAPASSRRTKETVSVETDDTLRTLLGAGMSPANILKEAENRISGSGRGTLSEGDLRYANMVASRRIAPGSAPVAIRGTGKSLSESQQQAVTTLRSDFFTGLAPKNLKDKEERGRWGFQNRKWIIEALENVAKLPPTRYDEYARAVVKQRGLDPQQAKVLIDFVPEYYASALTSFSEQKGDINKEVYGITKRRFPLP